MELLNLQSAFIVTKHLNEVLSLDKKGERRYIHSKKMLSYLFLILKVRVYVEGKPLKSEVSFTSIVVDI